jgi:adenylosuccinate synthase
MIKAVIGANYGDEGKGLMTDYFAAQSNRALVVRFNGGAQASHTVVTPEGFRHAFSHISSGTYAGVPTLLSKHFIINPMLFRKEIDILGRKMTLPDIWVDERCIVTTPYEMLLNQIIEEMRGKYRHGSCGVGINETVNRDLKYSIRAVDFYNEDYMLDVLYELRKNYILDRLDSLGFKFIPTDYLKILSSERIIHAYMEDIRFFKHNTCLINTGKIRPLTDIFDDVIFEGAQGLELDQNSMNFPHVTRSNTGLKNIVDIVQENCMKGKIDVTYVSRWYVTKHGAGNFPNEIAKKDLSTKIIDLTNVPNSYQGGIRYGLLDVDRLRDNITNDLIHGNTGEVNLAITCLDQLGLSPVIPIVFGGARKLCGTNALEGFFRRL